MTKHDGPHAAHPLATGVMGPPTTTTHRITIPMEVGPSIPKPGRPQFVGIAEILPSGTPATPAPCQSMPSRAPHARRPLRSLPPVYRAFGMAAAGYLNAGLLAFALWKAVAC
jgi:hypothetical protein